MLTNRSLYVIGQPVGKLCTSLGLLLMDLLTTSIKKDRWKIKWEENSHKCFGFGFLYLIFFFRQTFFLKLKKLIKVNQSSTPTITNLDDVIDFEIMNYDQNKEFIKVILGIKFIWNQPKKEEKQ